ncbi:p53 and DNA damage-regulated protein 1 [Saitoella coloradoensis]
MAVKAMTSSLDTLTTEEMLGEEIMMNQQLIEEYKRRQMMNSSTLNHMKDKLKGENKLWLNLDTNFIKLPRDKAQEAVEQNQKHLDVEISRLLGIVRKKKAEMEEIQKSGETSKGFLLRELKEAEDPDREVVL